MDTNQNIPSKHLELILNSSGDGVYGVDTRGRTTFLNPVAEEMTGYKAAELIGRGMHALIHHSHEDGSHYPGLECPIYEAFKDGKVHRVSREVFWRKDGSNFPVEYVSTPIFDDGALIGAVISFRDITERRKSERALHESEEQYRTMVEATHDETFVIDAESAKIVNATSEATELLGYTRAELLQMTVRDLHPHQPNDLEEFYGRIVRNGRAKSDKLSWQTASGSEIPLRISASVVVRSGRKYILALVQDQTEYVEAERRAQKLRIELSHAARVSAMGELASGLAHELNQPLTAVNNYMQACRMILNSADIAQTDQVLELLTKAQGQTERASQIISGLRSFVKKGEARRGLHDLNEVVIEACDLLFSSVADGEVNFDTNFASDLPLVMVNKVQIQQVVFNLTRNAMEAVGDTEVPRLCASTALYGQGADCRLRVSIKDNGVGVGDDAMARLFAAFTSTKAEGMGVGLSICKTIVEDHAGTIWADRNQNRGMTFAFELPVFDGKDANA